MKRSEVRALKPGDRIRSPGGTDAVVVENCANNEAVGIDTHRYEWLEPNGAAQAGAQQWSNVRALARWTQITDRQAVDELASSIEGAPARWACEEELQEHLGELLAARSFEREMVRGGDRFDLARTVDGLVVEVKVAGASGSVLRQLLRYASRDDVRGVVLATTKATHGRTPEVLAGKPVAVARLWLWGF